MNTGSLSSASLFDPTLLTEKTRTSILKNGCLTHLLGESHPKMTLVAEDFSFSYFSSTTPDNTSSDVHGSEENQAEEDLLYASYATVLPSEEQPEVD